MLMLTSFVVMGATYTASAQNISVTIAGMSGGEITAKQLSSDSVITTEPGYVIISFHLTIYTRGQNSPREFDGNYAHITEEMRRAISSTRADTKIYFEYIRIKDSNGKMVTGKPIAFTIK